VQAQFNTDVSYIAASALAAAQRNGQGTAAGALVDGSAADAVADPMAQAEAQANARKAAPEGFVAAERTRQPAPKENGHAGASMRNEEAIGGDDDDDIL
jgi:pre-mRNA-splicing factor SYF1